MDASAGIVGAAGTVGPYSFRLSDLAKATPLTPGTPVSSSLDPANDAAFYQFSAVAGQALYFAHVSGGAGAASWKLIDPYANVLFSTGLANDAGRLTLSADGTYTLLIEGGPADTGTDNYSFNVAPITDTTQALTLGSLVNGSMATPGELDRYTFSLANSSLLYFDSLTNSANIQWSLSGPAGIAVSNRPFNLSDGPFFTPMPALPAGAYTLTVSGVGPTTGAYAFRLSNLASAPALTVGTPVSGTLNPANSTNLYQFTANAGDQYTFLSGTSFVNATWRLLDPYGNVLFQLALDTSSAKLNLIATGTYSLLIEGNIALTGTLPYTFTAQFNGNIPPAPPTGTSLTLGSTVSGNLTTAGQQDRYIFTLAANAQLYFDSLTNNVNIVWSLSGPAGAVVTNRFNSDGPGTPLLSLPAGNYILTVSGFAASTGAYSFRLDNLASATPLTPGTPVSDTLNPGNSTNLYSFTAAAGQSFYFTNLAYSGGSVTSFFNDDWRLIDPYGNTVFTTLLRSDAGRQTLNAPGTYTLLVEGYIGDTVAANYAFNVLPITDQTQPLVLGNTVNSTLATPGEQDRYTFNLAANAQLYFDSLTNSSTIQWSLSGPSGTLVSNRLFSGSDSNSIFSNPVLIAPAGAYTLTVTGSGNATGAYAFRLLDLSTATPFTANAEVDGRLSPGTSTNIHQFTAKAGDTYYFESLTVPYVLTAGPLTTGAPANTGQWRLVDPYGNLLFTAALGSDAGLITLPADGTYTLLIEGSIKNNARLGYTFKAVRPAIDVVASDPGVPFVNQTGAISGITAPVQFNVQLQGNGQAQVYNLDFVSPATGIQLASIPVSIDAQYLYQVRAVDADRDTLTYSLTQAPAGMQIDPSTGLITWIPTAAKVGQNAVTVRVTDDHGGFDTQNFVVNVVALAPGKIEGTVFNDQNGDGQRNSTTNTPAPPDGPFQAVGTPFPAIAADSGPAIILTIGPNGVVTVTSTGQGPYDGSDDTYVGVVNEASSGVAVQSMQLSGNTTIFGFDADGIGGDGKTGYEGPGTFFTNLDGTISQSFAQAGQGANAGTVNFDDGLGNDLQPGQQTYFALEGVPTSVTGVIVKQVAPVTIEPALSGWTVYLDLNHSGTLDPGDPFTQSDSFGHYSFANLAPGAYTVAEVGQAGWQQTAPPGGTYVATVQSGQTTDGLDFGNMQLSTATPRKPVITSTPPATAAVQQRYSYTVAVNNPDGIALQFDLPVKPDGMVIDPDTGMISWYPTASEVGAQDVIVRLTDARNEVVLQHFQINVSLEAPPVITSQPPEPAVTGLPYRYQVLAQDAENNPLTYSLTQAPTGMTIDSKSGLISWVGAPIGPGLPSGYLVTVQVSDGMGGQDTQTFTLRVVANTGDQAPVITSTPPPSVGLGHRYLYAVQAADPDGDPLTYVLANGPAGMTIDNQGIVRWTPTSNQFGPNSVIVRVEDGRGGIADQPFTVTVTTQQTGQPPSITSTPVLAATLGRQYAYDATGVDPDGNPLIWSLDTAPAGMSIDQTQGTLRWDPTADQLGNQNVVLRLTDGAGLSTTQSYTVAVRAINVPPLITSTPPTQAAVGQNYTYTVQASDVDGDVLTYSLTAAPGGMTINASSGLIRWNPTPSQTGTQNVTVVVDDGQGGTATQTWSVVVATAPVNQAPVITSTAPLAPASGQPYKYQVLATDPDGDSVTFSLPVSPAGMTIDASGLIVWTPTAAQAGTNNVTVVATDPQGLSAVQNFSIVVVVVNDPPTITSTPPASVFVGQIYHYDVIASDPDGDPLSYTLTSAPAGMSIDSLGRITWSPTASQVPTQPVQVTVSDGHGNSVSQSYSISVSLDTQPPQVTLQLSANPADLGSSVTAVVTATDNVGVTNLSLTEDGVPLALDSNGTATIAADAFGSFTLVAMASDAAGKVGRDSQTLVVINPKVTNAPTVALTTPADSDMVTAPTQVIGTVQDPNLVSYTLSVA
ncbi:MAG TPA: putative Ig domain-containing protein, partial [Pirellulales bacterium]|nr:putative Ig domain-containing protein [Pirellulales bacterium]